MSRYKKKVFSTGDEVLFKRDTELSRSWEPGTYVAAVRDMPGWHHVRDKTGFTERHIVPTQRVKLAS